ncbi:MAG: holo-ACP synthase [Rhodospirillaceae bacterium]|nr:holo-ACP synthase [Rhodospirillaceae bacterium]|tara:strand:+ start:3010 stop:3408 length:399 start_codon:yes stop_codon:yes gene_type:complete
MIIGIGSDIININRIERVLERYGDRFIKRIFTPVEKEKSEQRISRVESYAKRFAAKEACAKALGTGFRKGIFWRDMGVVNLTSGQPTMQLTGNAEKRLIEITPDGAQSKIDISLTDEPPFAQAVVVITAVAS